MALSTQVILALRTIPRTMRCRFFTFITPKATFIPLFNLYSVFKASILKWVLMPLMHFLLFIVLLFVAIRANIILTLQARPRYILVSLFSTNITFVSIDVAFFKIYSLLMSASQNVVRV